MLNNLRIQSMFARQKLKDILKIRNTFGDKIRVSDTIFVFKGTAEDVKSGKAIPIFASKGHIVNAAFHSIINFMKSGGASSDGYFPSMRWGELGGWGQGVPNGKLNGIWVGTDVTDTPTVATSSDLSSGLNVLPNDESGAIVYSGGIYRVSWTATWNAGTISNGTTIKELGLFLWMVAGSTLGTFNDSYSATVNLSTHAWQTGYRKLFSRISVTDGDFASFNIDATVPLTIEWRLYFEFA